MYSFYTNGTVLFRSYILDRISSDPIYFSIGMSIGLPHSLEQLSGIFIYGMFPLTTLVGGHFRCFQSFALIHISVTSISGHIPLYT